jgi:plastocyanin
MNGRRVTLAALAALLAVGGAAACGGGGDGDAAGASEGDGLAGGAGEGDGGSTSGGEVPEDVVVVEGTEAHVDSLDNTFRAPNIEVKPGTKVVWTNQGRNDHDILPVEGEDWGAEVEAFQPGDVYEHTFDEPGVYNYYCSIHGTTTAGMIGAVVVAE